MITYSIKDIHKDIKYLLQPHGRKALWKPRYYKQLKEYILPDMIRLNQLCNQDGFRSFAVCVNDFMFQDAHGKPQFDMKKLDNLCKQNFGCTLEQAVPPQIIKDNIRDMIKPQSKASGMVPKMNIPNQGIVFYQITKFYPISSLYVPYHEYAHILTLKYNFFKNTKTYTTLSQTNKKVIDQPDNLHAKNTLQEYYLEFVMLNESFADCFAYSCLTLKEPNNNKLKKQIMFHISGKLCQIIQEKKNVPYCGFAVTRTMLNRIQFDNHHNNMQKYYLQDGSIDFLKLAQTCAEVVRQQAYNHENFQTLSTVSIQEPQNLSNLKPSQYDQWYYDYLDALQYQKKYQPYNVYYRFFAGLGEIALNPSEKTNFYKLLDKYTNPELQPYLNEYRKILQPQIKTISKPQNLAQLIQTKSRK